MPLAPETVATEVYTSPSALSSLRYEWLSLYREAVGVTPFQSPAWLIPWYEVWGQDRTHLVVARDDKGGVIGILPAVRTAQGLELAGSGVGDYLAPLLSASSTTLAAQACDLALDGVACGFHDVPMGVPWAVSNPAAWTARRASTMLSIPLPATFDLFRQSLSAGLRRNLRRYRERLEREADVEFGTVEDLADLPDVLEALFELHAARWRERHESGVFAAEDVREFHRLAAPALQHEGLLRMHYLRYAGTIAGVIYAIVDRRRAFSYIGGFDPALNACGPGSLLLAHAIQSAIAEGCHSYDFLRGCEPYKRAWGAVEHTTLSLSKCGDRRAV